MTGYFISVVKGEALEFMTAPAPSTEGLALPSRRYVSWPPEVRITYRTVRVLSAIADSPDASNRVVADLAGVNDVGQISRMLSRLERLGLLRNAMPRGPKSGANAWKLTEAGEHLLRLVRVEAGRGSSSRGEGRGSARSEHQSRSGRSPS